MPTNNETWNNTGQPVGGTDDGIHFRILKTLSDGTVVTTGGGGGGTVDQGTPAVPANAWPTKLVDAAGVNEAAVDAAGNVQVDVNNFPATQPVSGTVAVSNFPASQPVTDAAAEASLSSIDGKTPVLVSGAVPVTGPLTDTQLRATPVPISGTVTATGPLTDTQLRATPVPVSGTVTATGPLTDTQLRATPVPISAASLPLPTGRHRIRL